MNGAHDGPAPVAIRCSAGHVLGMQIGPVCVIKHDRRTYVGVLFHAQCKCGAVWTSDALRAQIGASLDGLRRAWDVADLPELEEAPVVTTGASSG